MLADSGKSKSQESEDSVTDFIKPTFRPLFVLATPPEEHRALSNLVVKIIFPKLKYILALLLGMMVIKDKQ